MPIPCQASFFIDTSNLQPVRDIEDNVDSTRRDPARKLYYSRLFSFPLLFFFLFLPQWSRTTTCLRISSGDPLPLHGDPIVSSPFLDSASRFFAPFFAPPFLSALVRNKRTIVERRRVPEEIPFSLSSLRYRFPAFSQLSPPDLSFHLPFNRRPSPPNDCSVFASNSSNDPGHEERDSKNLDPLWSEGVLVETARGAPISRRGLGRPTRL